MFSNTLNKISGLKKNYTMEAKVFPCTEYVMNFDGASRGNPGLSGAGAVIYKNSEEIWSSCKFVGTKTNNQSEYSALILGLKGALTLGITNLSVLGDSLLVINQVNGLYRVKSSSIFDLYEEVLGLKSQFNFVEFNHVYREYNKRADELSNLALDQPCDLQTDDLQTDFIKELDEDWTDEVKLDELIQQKHKIVPPLQLFVRIPSAKKPTKTKDKQLSITQFFKIGSLFPDI
jgi:ribonuclease HI